ncbi:MAG TPA: hypothetical protein VMY37_40505 [Thermoguttaceae bacterium]|nr:hypothetical protein [Thermoguttaceae bacterium]
MRRDVVALLSFVRDNKVIGTQGTGNMPLKAVREVTARFVDPLELETVIGDKTYRLRSEEDLWPLYLLHVLAEVGGLMKTGRARRWRLTAQGERFLRAEPILQVPFLLAVWWHRVNWLIAYPLQGMGHALPHFFPEATLASLRSMPIGVDIPFDEFADGLIAATGLTWTAEDSRFAASALRASIERMVIGMLARFGAVECKRRKEPLGRGTISRLVSFNITAWGMTVLNAIAILRR